MNQNKFQFSEQKTKLQNKMKSPNFYFFKAKYMLLRFKERKYKKVRRYMPSKHLSRREKL